MTIMLCDNTKPIRTGSATTRVTVTGLRTSTNTQIIPALIIDDISDLYDDRWDDIHYYTGGSGSTDGGDVGGNVIDGGTYSGG